MQLLKIYNQFCDEVAKIWVNSHQDCIVYQEIIAEIACFSDDQAGFLGPLMGMKSAWAHVTTDYILFIPAILLLSLKMSYQKCIKLYWRQKILKLYLSL